jgi:hypothetical protein
MIRDRQLFALVLGSALAAGCAGLLGLDEVTESSRGEEGGSPTDTGMGAIDGDGDASSSDGDASAGTDASSDAPFDAPVDVFDAGCGAIITTDFTAVALPPQANQYIDGTGSTLTFDTAGVGGSRAMHVTVPVGGTGAGLNLNVQALALDGAQSCAITCGVDVKLVKRGGAATELVVQGTALSANISHSSTFTYFSRTEAAPEAPDLGSLPLGAFAHLEIDVSGTAAPFAAKGALGASTSAKALMFFPVSARFGIEKIAADPEVEAIIDNVVCRSRRP